jgi:hypothetical protein
MEPKSNRIQVSNSLDTVERRVPNADTFSGGRDFQQSKFFSTSNQ